MTSSGPRRRSPVLWLFPIAFALHNLEEAIWLPGWSRYAGRFHPPVGAVELRFALAVLTVGGFLLTAMALRRGGRWFLALTGLWGVMLLNVLFPHLLATVALGRYAPGLATALLLILPVNAYLLRRAFQERALTPGRFARACAVVALVIVGAIPLLFWLGRFLFAA
ncbi:HXXEE domain-containing protein [Pyxidicoccus trucidator]|uniref:HXXEE domain-containing protein n=1 Tax=Pyxidicoccus trucidator TaxID=2709662 RepID=UPI0013DB0E6B|nr:HXXEE domain-containing protein [Pyxidicoccus trucidator]